jgi:Phosphotransferase enzyme family
MFPGVSSFSLRSFYEDLHRAKAAPLQASQARQRSTARALIHRTGHVNLMCIVHLDEAIPPTNQIDKVWLTTVLKKVGALTSGEIGSIDVDASPSTNSHIARIRIEYKAEIRGDAPRSLILKTVEADAGFVTSSEVNYYARDYRGLTAAPIPKCYAAHVADNGSYSILMEDLSDTHEKDTSPSGEYGIALATALARLHAYGWGEARINQLGGSIPDASKLDQYVGHVRRGLDSLLEATRTDIPDSWRQTTLDIFQNHPGKMLGRTKDAIGFTIVHGDVNPGNILYPIGEGRVYFLDRQPFTWSLTTWLGASDLSYLMVQYWSTDLRRDLELSVLREYHRTLLANGVTGYDWDQLIADYKLCAVQATYTAAEWCIQPEDRERMRWLWRLELERAMHAFFDLSCAGLW